MGRTKILSPAEKQYQKDKESFEAQNGTVKYAKGVMNKFGLKERTIKVKEITYE